MYEIGFCALIEWEKKEKRGGARTMKEMDSKQSVFLLNRLVCFCYYFVCLFLFLSGFLY